MSDQPRPRPRPVRADPRDVAELKQLRTSHPELAGAVDMQLELAELARRLHGRLRTPILTRDASANAARLAVGDRLIDFDDLLVDWSDFRLILRQTADVLHRSGALDAGDHQRLQETVRQATRVEPLARDYYERTARPDRYRPAPASEPALLDDVLLLCLRPFVARCAEAWRPRLTLGDWQRGYCPLCGLQPDFATLLDSDRLLICGRCTSQWPYPLSACPFCGASDVTSFASRDGRYRVYGCNNCRKYLKAYDARGASRPVLPVVDTIATLPLDAAAIQQGYEG